MATKYRGIRADITPRIRPVSPTRRVTKRAIPPAEDAVPETSRTLQLAHRADRGRFPPVLNAAHRTCESASHTKLDAASRRTFPVRYELVKRSARRHGSATIEGH